jgi:hypothetical protein
MAVKIATCPRVGKRPKAKIESLAEKRRKNKKVFINPRHRQAPG